MSPLKISKPLIRFVSLQKEDRLEWISTASHSVAEELVSGQQSQGAASTYTPLQLRIISA